MKELSIDIKRLSDVAVDIQILDYYKGTMFYRYYPHITPEVSLDTFVGRVVKFHLEDSNARKKEAS